MVRNYLHSAERHLYIRTSKISNTIIWTFGRAIWSKSCRKTFFNFNQENVDWIIERIMTNLRHKTSVILREAMQDNLSWRKANNSFRKFLSFHSLPALRSCCRHTVRYVTHWNTTHGFILPNWSKHCGYDWRLILTRYIERYHYDQWICPRTRFFQFESAINACALSSDISVIASVP